MVDLHKNRVKKGLVICLHNRVANRALGDRFTQQDGQKDLIDRFTQQAWVKRDS